METHLKPEPKSRQRRKKRLGDDSAFEESFLLFFFRGNGAQPHRDLALFVSSLSSICPFLLPPDLVLHSHLHLRSIISLPP